MNFDDTIKKGSNYVETDFDKIFVTLKNYVEASNKKYEESNKDKNIFNGVQKVNCVIMGINNFKNKLSDENQTAFEEIFKDANDLRLVNYTIVDTVDNIKKISYDAWFKDNSNLNNGIYIGNGLADQMLINVGKRVPEMKEELQNNFGFVIKRGTPSCIKFIEKYKEN